MKDVVSDSTDTRNESKLRPQEASAPKISQRGISAMQGKVPPVDTPKLNHRELRDVEVRSARHLKTPAVNDRENTNKMKAYEHKLQGEMGEESMRKLGAESLNDYKNNFPVYDFISKDEVASVKTHMPSEEYKTSHLSNYAHDFRVAMGTTVAKKGVYDGKTSTSFAADALNQLSQRPEGWERISPGRMEAKIKEKATLRIPSDHVEPVQNYVRRAALRYPERYGFDHLPDNEELNQLTNRIKPLPINSKQIQDRVQARVQGLTQSMSL